MKHMRFTIERLANLLAKSAVKSAYWLRYGLYDSFHRREEFSDHLNIPRLYVDVSTTFRSDAGTGIQRVVRSLMNYLIEGHGRDYQLVPVVATKRRPFMAITIAQWKEKDLRALRIAKILRVRPGDIFFCLDFSSHLLPLHRIQIQKIKLEKVLFKVLVYDLLPIIYPQFFTMRNTRNYEAWFDVVTRYADDVLCISKAVAQDFRNYAVQRRGLSCPMPVHVVPMGGDITSSRPSTGVSSLQNMTLEFLRKRRVILMVGTVEPRKAYQHALSAMEKIWTEDPNSDLCLVISGKLGWKVEFLAEKIRKHPEYNVRLFWMSDASDEVLDLLYKSCFGLLMTSYAEGYGLPVLEALRLGKPTLVRDIPVFRELGDQSGISYFIDDNPVELARDIISWVDAPLPPITGKEQYTWEQAGAILKVALGFVRA